MIRDSIPAAAVNVAPADAQRACNAPAPRVALLGPYASRNLGDTATQMAAIAGLRRIRPELQIVGLSPDPEDTLSSLDLPAFPLSGYGAASGMLLTEFPAAHSSQSPAAARWLRSLRRRNAFVRSLDLLVFSGGGQLDDFWGGPFGHPWSMLQWTVLARRHEVPVAFAGIGLDRLSTPLSRRFALGALERASYVSFRDRQTQHAMQEMGLRRTSVVCPDLAFGLTGREPQTSAPVKRFAVLNPISQRTWSHTTQQRHEQYLRELADAGAWLAGRQLGLRIACSQKTMDGTDAALLGRMLAERQVREVEICDTSTVEDYVSTVRGAELVVASRLHGAILSLVAGSPVIALPAQPKVRHLMAEVDLAELTLPLQSFTAAQLIEQADSALARVEELKNRIAQVNQRFRAQLGTTFADLVNLLG